MSMSERQTDMEQPSGREGNPGQEERAPQEGSVFTLGYAQPDASARLTELLASNPLAILVDIRSHPYSRRYPQWTKQALQATYGSRYVHIQAFGNVQYRIPGAPVQLLDPEEGIRWAIRALQAGYSLILLCACREEERCHRTLVAQLIEAARWRAAH